MGKKEKIKLSNILIKRDTTKNEITNYEFKEAATQNSTLSNGICAICGGNYVLGGHNPAPVITEDEDARCCSRCNAEVVIPARFEYLMQMYSGGKK